MPLRSRAVSVSERSSSSTASSSNWSRPSSRPVTAERTVPKVPSRAHRSGGVAPSAHRRHVEVQRHPGRGLEQPVGHPGGERRRRAPGPPGPRRPFALGLAHGQRPQPEVLRGERRADGAGVQDHPAGVGPGVDAGDHGVELATEPAEHARQHAHGRRSGQRPRLDARTPGQLGPLHRQVARQVEAPDRGGGAAGVVVGGHHDDLVTGVGQRSRQGVQARTVDPVVVGDQQTRHGPTLARVGPWADRAAGPGRSSGRVADAARRSGADRGQPWVVSVEPVGRAAGRRGRGRHGPACRCSPSR